MSGTLPATDPPPGPVEADALALRVDGVDYRWADVVAHARRRGDWQILDSDVRHALACRRLAVEEGRPLSRAAERSVAVAFRRARRLHAAEDLEAWLEARGLTVAQWRRYIQSEALRLRHAAELDTVVERCPVDDTAVRNALSVWGRCSGAFTRWAEELATRAAAAHAVCERAGDRPPEPHDLEALEVLYDRYIADVATPERLEALVATRYLDWLRLDIETVAFDDHDTAAEALLCIRDDGWSLPDVARAGGGRLRRHRLLVEELDPEIRHPFVRAQDGDLLGPLPLGGTPTLVEVRRKVTPSVDDDEVRLEATRQLVAAATAREVADRVEWLHPR